MLNISCKYCIKNEVFLARRKNLAMILQKDDFFENVWSNLKVILELFLIIKDFLFLVRKASFLVQARYVQDLIMQDVESIAWKTWYFNI